MIMVGSSEAFCQTLAMPVSNSRYLVNCEPSGTQQQLVAGVAAPSVVSLCSFDWSKAEIFFNVYKYFYHLSASVSLDTVDWTTLSSCDCRDKSLLRTIHTPKKLSSAVSQQFRSRGGYSGENILDKLPNITVQCNKSDMSWKI